MREKSRKWYKKHRDNWYNKNKEILNFKRRLKYMASTPEQNRASKYKNNYDLSVEKYNEIVKKQQGLCTICGSTPEKNRGKILHVDHDHKTKKVRGLLCYNCNHGLGNFRDNPVILQLAIKYLQTAYT